MYKKQLLALGIPASIDGFEYLNYAIEIYNPPQSLISLYEEIGKKFNVSGRKVMRAMRHAIKLTGEKITSGEFVAKYKILWAVE